MDESNRGGRKLKAKVLGLLKYDDLEEGLRELCLFEPRGVFNALVSLYYGPEDDIRWRAITATGVVVASLAENDREAARVMIRRLIWSLNDESGGIGWGAPEAMAEIMCHDEVMAEEYSRIFISYLDERGNFLEYEALQEGLLWGLARLASVRPRLFQEAIPHLGRYLESSNTPVRGLAARAAGLLGAQELRLKLAAMLEDEAGFELYDDGRVVNRQVREMAREALTMFEIQRGAADADHGQSAGP